MATKNQLRLSRRLIYLTNSVKKHSLFAKQQYIGPPNMPRQQKDKLFWHQSGQKAKKNETYPVKPTYTVLGQPTKSLKSDLKRANQPHGIMPQKAWDDYMCPMHSNGHIQGLCW